MNLFGETSEAPSGGLRNGMSAHEPNSGEGLTNEWYTPPRLFEALGLRFDLDPASPLEGPVPWVPADRFINPVENGLLSIWEGRVWLNPPYGRDVGRWVGKLAEHGDGIALVFARTETPWFQQFAARASALLFIRGRLSFVDRQGRRGKGNAGAPSVLMGWGDVCRDALESSGLGWCLRP